MVFSVAALSVIEKQKESNLQHKNGKNRHSKWCAILLHQDLQMATGILRELLRHQCCQKLTWNARKSRERCLFFCETWFAAKNLRCILLSLVFDMSEPFIISP